jgi:ribonuclease H2 subunit A
MDRRMEESCTLHNLTSPSPDIIYGKLSTLAAHTQTHPPPSDLDAEDWILGVDEAGRGPVLGPMVYGIALCPLSHSDKLKALGVDDSKVLNADFRANLFVEMQGKQDWIRYAVNVNSGTRRV